MRFLHEIVITFRDFIYPPLCFVCTRRLSDGDERVCTGCWSAFSPFRVGDPVWHELHNRFVLEGVVSNFLSCFYFEKQGTLQKVLHLLKYRGMKTMGVLLGREVGRRIAGHHLFSQADYLVPVPLHPLKERERGFNQCTFLCQGVADVTRIPIHADIIRRAKYTRSQTQLTLEERKQNVGDAFRISDRHRADIHGKTIVLIDDVITTGSTINACARELARAGAQTVLAASAAVAR